MAQAPQTSLWFAGPLLLVLQAFEFFAYKYFQSSPFNQSLHFLISQSQPISSNSQYKMAEKIVTQQPQGAKPFFLHPTQDFNTQDIKNSLVTAIDNIKSDGTGLSATNGAPQPYETGLFDCFADIPTCLLSWCCGPCLFHRTYHVLNRAPSEYPEDEFVGGTCLAYCLSGCLTGIGACVWTAMRRGAIREKYNLSGSTRMDCALSCCCAPCVLGQEDIEVRKREKRSYEQYKNSQQQLSAEQF